MGLEREDFNSVRIALLSMKAILACVPVFMLSFALKPSAELFVVGWGCVSAWFRPPFLYVVLNVVIITLGVKSGALTTSSTSDQPEVLDDAQMDNSTDLYISKVEACSDSDRCTTLGQDTVAVEEEVAVSKPDEKCAETQLVCSNLINEVDAGQTTSSVCNEEKEKEEEDMLSAEELYEKSEMFIGNFYRELKLQQIE